MENPFISEIAERLSALLPLDAPAVAEAVTTPPDEALGDYAFPCFAAAKQLGRKPHLLADELASRLGPSERIREVKAAGPYLNFFVRRQAFIQWVLKKAHAERDRFGHAALGEGRTVVVEFSSPNIAKHLAVHHVRSTMIGNALAKIFRALGYRVVSINFLGDWGTQFGGLIAAYKRWGDEQVFQGDAVSNLNELYVRFNLECEAHPELRDEGRAWFRRLEQGDPEAVALWRRFREVSLAAFEEVYRRLGVRFDVVSGESRYETLMPETIRRLEEKGLAQMSEGALIVDLSARKMPPVLLRKSDGATLYDTRDIAAAEDRWNRYHFDRMIYVVGGDQRLHFRQIFEVLRMMGHAWADRCIHVDFGIIRLRSDTGAAKMSTRRGEAIMLKEVLDEAVQRVRRVIEEKNPSLPDKEAVAEAVGIGAVVFNDLKRQRIKDVDFDWDEILNFEGETGPYVQYAHVRLCSILKKYGRPASDTVDYSRLGEPEEFGLAKALAAFGPAIRRAAEAYEPSVISQYLLDLCGRFSTYYHKHRVVGDDPALSAARVLLVDALRQTIANGLALLGIQAPEEM